MSAQQPVWVNVGHVGDVDPIAHGGGFVYVDSTGVYGPEMTWFEPGSDEEWDTTQGATKLKKYRILLENNPEAERWPKKLDEVLRLVPGLPGYFKSMAESDDPMKRALVYECLIKCFGVDEFDQDPVELSEDEAYAQYADEMKMSLLGVGRQDGECTI